jgi:hypothetical protein
MRLSRCIQISGTFGLHHVFKTSKEKSLKVYKIMVVPTLLHMSKNWTLTKQHERGTEMAEIIFLRLTVGHTLYYHKANKEI